MGNSLKELRLAKKWTQEKAATELGMSYKLLVKLENGERNLTSARVKKAAEIFGVSTDRVLREPGSGPTLEVAEAAAPYIPQTNEADLKVFAAAEGGPGVIVVSSDPIRTVTRPWYLGDVTDGFAVLIAGDSMEPAYEPGDMAVVNPHLPPVRDADFIFTSGDDRDDGDWRGTIKRLRGWTEREWRVEQFNPRKEYTLSRKDWPKVLRVVSNIKGR
jgi:phage repressor protein C with HTH and peptisase S24 domain